MDRVSWSVLQWLVMKRSSLLPPSGLWYLWGGEPKVREVIVYGGEVIC